MYICKKCKRTFENPCNEYDDIGYRYSVCPYCEDDRIEDATTCEQCSTRNQRPRTTGQQRAKLETHCFFPTWLKGDDRELRGNDGEDEESRMIKNLQNQMVMDHRSPRTGQERIAGQTQ